MSDLNNSERGNTEIKVANKNTARFISGIYLKDTLKAES